MENCWRSNLAQNSREKIVNRIHDTVLRYLPPSPRLNAADELLEIARRFEEKIFRDANDQIDYLRKISRKMLALETVSKTNPVISDVGASSSNIGEIEVEHAVVSAPISFVEVEGPDGKKKRFAEGTRAGFVVDRLNKLQVNDSRDMTTEVVCIQAYKEGEEPIVYGPQVELHILPDNSWTLQSVSEYVHPITALDESMQSKKLCLRPCDV